MCIRDRTSAAPRTLAGAAGNVVSLTFDPTCCRSVAYTHLDVYKRQDFGCASHFGRCRWQRCLPYVRPDLLQVCRLYTSRCV
ncbi:hypothetical protein [Erwinia amylovora]